MEDILRLIVQSSGAAAVAFIAFHYSAKSHALFMMTMKEVTDGFNTTINNHLREANAAQREEAKAKLELALKLEDLANQQREAKEVNERLYLDLVKMKNPVLYKKIRKNERVEREDIN